MIASITRRLLSRLPGRTGGLLLGLALLGCAGSAQAFLSLGMFPGFYFPEKYYRFGAVYTRAIVPGPNGRPVYVEYDTTGKEVRQIGEAIGELERVQVQAADYYRSLLARLDDVRSRYPDSRVFSAAEYRAQTFKTVTGETITKPNLESSSKSAVVRAANQLFDKNGKDLLLLELPIKWDERPFFTSKSLIVSEEGKILHESPNTFGLRVGFFGKDGQVSEGVRRPNDAQIYGPLADVNVTLGGFIPGGIATTDEEGKYRMQYSLPPCPGFFFEYTTPAYLELFYKRFNPRSSSYMPYTLSRANYDFCNGMGIYSIEAAAIVASIATPVKQPADFPIDLMVLDGAANLGEVAVAAKTEYSAEVAEHAHYLQQSYDFDGDETPDYVVPGKMEKKDIDGEEAEVFVRTPVEDAELQGIYLSTQHSDAPEDTEKNPPDFTRLIDTEADFRDRGLLKSISKHDLQDTDIYVFRESTGQLVAERRGLHEDELYKSYSGVDEEQGAFRYTIQLRGSVENYYTALSDRRGEDGFQKWQSAGGFREEFQKRTANHLKAGEVVRIIAINRPTGYLGSTTVQLESAMASGNLLTFPEHQIEMLPPNLKIWAERRNEVEYGMTAGEQMRQVIGNEGAGLGSDISIAIYTDWRDSDGSPLPEELADYGYTGRLAKVVGNNQLAPQGANQLSQFTIKPGYQVQVIHLPEKVLAKQHLYLQVAGQPSNRNPDFSSGEGGGILQYRPSRYVPVKVPLHDEDASELARQAYRKADREHPELNLKKPEPLYAWQYRTELQFSMYDLNLEAIRKTDADDRIRDILHDKKPVLTSSDNLLEFYYDLLKSEFNELQPWEREGQREMVLAVGEQEIKATLGADQTIRFDNFDHLGKLDVDDFLTIRLYANNDAGNTLMEWAFEYLSVFPNADEEINDRGEVYFLSADDPKVEMKALLAGYYSRKESAKVPQMVTWNMDGAGAVSPQLTVSPDAGIFTTQVTMPTSAGSRGRVYASLQGSDARAYYKDFIVVPGAPAQIAATFRGSLFGGGVGELVADIHVTDRSGNDLLQGASVDFSIEGQGRLVKDGGSLIDGRAQAVIRNAVSPGGGNFLVVRVGELEKKFPFDVSAFSVNSQGGSDSVYENTEEELSFALSGVSLDEFDPSTFQISVDHGLVLDRIGKVKNGKLVYRWHTGYSPGQASVTYSDGLGGHGTRTYAILPNPAGRIVDKKPVALVVGGAGDLAYQRVNGEQILVPVARSETLTIKGQPGEKVRIQVGDSAHPNLQDLYALAPSSMERGRMVDGGRILALSPGFQYALSERDRAPVAFNYKGYPLMLRNTDALEQAVSGEGLELDLFYEMSGSGHLLSWKDLFTLKQTPEKLLISYKTGEGKFEEQSVDLAEPTSLRELHLTLRGRRLDYRLGSAAGSVELAEGVTASSGAEITLLATQNAALRRFNAIAAKAVPLMRANGQPGSSEIILDAGGRAQLPITAAIDELSSSSRQIPLYVGDDLITVTLLKPETALSLLAPIVEMKGVSPNDVREILGQDVRTASAFAPQVALAANIRQSSVADSAKAMGLFDVVASFPEGRYLAPHRQAFARYLGSQPPERFVSALIDELGAVISLRQDSSLSLGYKRMLGMLVFSELLASDSAGVVNNMAASVRDRVDLEVWLDWMAMPANGWALFDPPTPDVEQSCTVGVEYVLDPSLKIPVNPCRLTGEQFGQWLADFITISPDFATDPDELREQLTTIQEGLASSNYDLRTSLFGATPESVASWDPTSLFIQKSYAAAPLAVAAPIVLRMVVQAMKKLAVRLGKNAAKNLAKFALGKSNYRIHPMIFLFAAAYVEEQIATGQLSTGRSSASAKFWSTLGLFVARLALENGSDGVVDIEETLQKDGGYNCRVMNFSHGNMYEIVMIAFYQAMGMKIKELDRQVVVTLYGDNTLIRKPDIELAGSGDSNIWVELKSVQAGPSYRGDDKQLPTKHAFLNRFPVFNAPEKFRGLKSDPEEKRSGKNEYHKQFVLDRIAAYGYYGNRPSNVAEKMHWRFQKWKPRLIKYKRPVLGRNAAGNGYPMSTRVRGNAGGTYLGLIKERFAEIPVKKSDFKDLFKLDSAGVRQKEFEEVQMRLIFLDPAVKEALEDLEDLDEYFFKDILGRMGYSAEQLERLRRYASSLDAIQERIGVVESWIDRIKAKLYLDFEDKIADKIQEKGEELAEKLGVGGSCETNY